MKNPSAAKQETQQQLVERVLESLKQACQDLQANPNSTSAIKALVELLKTDSYTTFIVSTDPHLSTLSHHLSALKTLQESPHHHHHRDHHQHLSTLKSLFISRFNSHEIARLAGLIEAEIQAWFHHQRLMNLTNELRQLRASGKLVSSATVDDDDDHHHHEEALLWMKLDAFMSCLTQGFNIMLQHMLLKSNIFTELKHILANENMSKHVREKVAYALKCLVLFNKDVFVGHVLTGQRQTLKALIKMGTFCSLGVLHSLTNAMKSPLIDEMKSFGGIMEVVNSITSMDLSVKIAATECVQEIGFYGGKEAIEAMLNAGLIQRLMGLQRSEIELDINGGGHHHHHHHHHHRPFASCVARFAVQIEVGEGLRRRGKRAFKHEIVKRVREASVSDSEAAIVIAEFLWGSSP